MAVTGISAVKGLPFKSDVSLTTASATGNISVGDWLAYSGQFVVATNSGHTAFWKTSGAGVALESNPMTDQWGNSDLNSGMKILTQGTIHVTAAFSGVIPHGVGAYPVTTGSGVGAATGLTGLGTTWQTAQVRFGSALSGTANGQQPAVGTVIGSQNFSNAGTGELIVRIMPLAPDVRG